MIKSSVYGSVQYSSAVIDELKDGKYAKKDNCLSLLDDIPLLVIEPDVIQITATYLKHKLMPNEPTGDALHLALASYHKCDFLLTWNCQHLANANKFKHIRQINTLLGLFVPNLVTPLELLGEQSDE
jgi:predicted nucleic acid-binding protein